VKKYRPRRELLPESCYPGPLTRTDVRIADHHARGGRTGTLTGTYMHRGAYYAYIPSLRIYSVVWPDDWTAT
jgi:hypothetical protein